MKLTKKLTTLAIVGAISATTAVASAANIGLVQMSQVVNSYPGYGALDMKMQQVDAQYRPQIEKKMQEIDKIKDQAQAEHYVKTEYNNIKRRLREAAEG